MIEVKIPKEIHDFKEAIVAGLNARQLVCVILTLLICIPLYIFGVDILGEDIASWLCIFVALPCAAIGFFSYNGMPLEKFVFVWIKFNFICPQKRTYIVENFYEYLIKLYDTITTENVKSKKYKFKKG